MLNVGLTGGIGSGKSTVADLFSKLKIPVYSADERAKLLMRDDPALRKSIIEEFGDEVYQNGELDRKYLASLVFNDEVRLAKLNSLVHPSVRKDYSSWCKKQDAAYNIREAAILFESGAYRDCDRIILVSAPDHIRIQRVIKRDGPTEVEVRSRMDKQWTDEKRKELSHYFINNEERSDLESQVLKIHKEIMELTLNQLS